MGMDRYTPETHSARSLREALVPEKLLQQPAPRREADTEDPGLVWDRALLPTAPELLNASPSLRRLCAQYHSNHRRIDQRNRRQRIGIALLVASIGVSSVALVTQGRLQPAVVSTAVLGAAAASCLALAILALLWTRDNKRLRSTQGERLVRALVANCTLPPDRMRAFRRLAHPAAAFFDCYECWLQEQRDSSPLRRLVASIRGDRDRPLAGC